MMHGLYVIIICQCLGFIFCLPCDSYLNNGGSLHLENFGNCYILFEVLKPYQEASQECGNKGLHLVFLETATEQSWLEYELNSRALYYVVWTGLRYIDSKYRWQDGFNAITYGILDDITRIKTGIESGVTINPGNYQLIPTQDGDWHHYVCESNGFVDTGRTTHMVSTGTFIGTTSQEISTEEKFITTITPQISTDDTTITSTRNEISTEEKTVSPLSTEADVIATTRVQLPPEDASISSTSYPTQNNIITEKETIAMTHLISTGISNNNVDTTPGLPTSYVQPTALGHVAQNNSSHDRRFTVVSGQIHDLHLIASFSTGSIIDCVRRCADLWNPSCHFVELIEISKLCFIYTQDANISPRVTKTCDGVTTTCCIRQ